jgi:hypothetical protein
MIKYLKLLIFFQKFLTVIFVIFALLFVSSEATFGAKWHKLKAKKFAKLGLGGYHPQPHYFHHPPVHHGIYRRSAESLEPEVPEN